MTTIDDITEAAKAWLARHPVLPDRPLVIAEGRYADGVYVSIGFNPDTFGDPFDSAHAPIATLIYRLDANGRMAMTPVAPDFALHVGFSMIHERTARLMESR